MKPPSRKHYEKSEVERLKEKIRQLETKTPEYKELEDRLEIARLNLLSAQTYERELKGALNNMRTFVDYFDVLKRSEVMVVTPEGMKYLVGQDLEDFCKAEIDKQNLNKVWWGDPVIPSAFAQHARDHLSKIIRDEIDSAAVHQAITYKTKGRYNYDPRSKSKKEGS